MLKFLKRNSALVLSLPGVILLIPLFLIPITSVLVVSFFTYSPGKGFWIYEFTLDNYLSILSSPIFLDVMTSTLRIAVIVMILSLILGYPIAYSIARSRSENFRRLLVIISILTFFMSWVPRLFAWIIILGRYGAVNAILNLLKLYPVKILGSEWAIIIGLTHAMTPLTALVMMGPIKNIDITLEEAAKSLGANSIQTFLKVTLPLSMPGIISALVLTYSIAISAFITPMMLGQGVTLMLSNYVYARFGETLNFPYGAALATILLSTALITSYVISTSLMKLVKVK